MSLPVHLNPPLVQLKTIKNILPAKCFLTTPQKICFPRRAAATGEVMHTVNERTGINRFRKFGERRHRTSTFINEQLGVMVSPANPKLGLRMTTLHKEQLPLARKHSLDLIVDDETEEKSELEHNEGKTDFYSKRSSHLMKKTLPTSRTLDSLVELAPRANTPSTNSSGYGSQAVSSTNLSSEDSMSLKSISVDETPDLELRPSNDLQPVTESVNNNDEHNVDNLKSISKETAVLNKQEIATNGSDGRGVHDVIEKESELIKTNLIAGKVVRRKKSASSNNKLQNTIQRASFPQGRPQFSESKYAQSLEQKGLTHDDGMDSSTDRLEAANNKIRPWLFIYIFSICYMD